MGSIISYRDFCMIIAGGVPKPIVYCGNQPPLPMSIISLNKSLAEELVKFQISRRSVQIEKCLVNVIEKLSENKTDIAIAEFDVLFNPDYKIDVLKILISACKKKPFDVVWCGTFNSGKLIYSEEKYRDYKEYKVSNYDITCVI